MGNKLHFLMFAESAILIYTFIILLLGSIAVECRSFETDENILMRRCELMCYRKTVDKCSVQSCMDDIAKLMKPGKCPHRPNWAFEHSYLPDCFGYDYECPGIQKCCKQKHLWSCQEPAELTENNDIPPIPFNVTITERRKRGRICGISWHMPLSYNFKHAILFVVEARSHIGSVFSGHKLGDWHWYDFHKIAELKNLATHTKTTLANLKLKTGRWYQFRVAAVNEFGYRGYSNYSREFRLSEAPKSPRPPKNFSVTPVEILKNNTLHARATWLPPKSDLPIEKYRISWALYLKGDNDSLLLSDAYVREPIRQFDLWNLAVNSLYYIQVQAISVSGNKRLKSSKESVMLNTTVTVNKTGSWPLFALINSTEYGTFTQIGVKSSVVKTRQPEISIRFVHNKKFGMLAKVRWSELVKGSLLELCPGPTDCDTKNYEIIKPKKNQIYFHKLKFNTQYTIRLMNPECGEDKDVILSTKSFTTPSCENWKHRFSSSVIACQ